MGGFAIGARISLLRQHSAEREMSASACTRSMPGFACYLGSEEGSVLGGPWRRWRRPPWRWTSTGRRAIVAARPRTPSARACSRARAGSPAGSRPCKKYIHLVDSTIQLTSGYAMVVHGRPKTPKIQLFGGHPAPRGRTAPIFWGTQLHPDM